MTTRSLAAPVLAAVLMLMPAISMACPMCYGSSSARVLQSYYLTAALLSLLPFAVIGCIAVLVYRMKRNGAGADERRSS